MKLLWEHGPLFVREMLELYPDPKPHFNTVSTFLRLMEQKGFVSHEVFGNSHRYCSLIKPDEYSRSALRNVIKTYFNNSMRNVVSALVADNNLTAEHLHELIDQVKNNQNSEEA